MKYEPITWSILLVSGKQKILKENQVTINMKYNIIFAEIDRRVSFSENQFTYS